MTTAPHGIQTIQLERPSRFCTHQHVSAKDGLIGKPSFHFEPAPVMQLLGQRMMGQDAALNEFKKNEVCGQGRFFQYRATIFSDFNAWSDRC